MFLCNSDRKHLSRYKARFFGFVHVFFITKFLFYVIYAKAKIIGVTDIFLNPFAGEQWSFNSSKVQQNVDYVQIDLWYKQERPTSKFELTLMRESFLKCFADYAAYPNEEWDFQKRKSFICAGTAEQVWRASLCFSYHQKLEEIQCMKAPISSPRGDCLLSTTDPISFIQTPLPKIRYFMIRLMNFIVKYTVYSFWIWYLKHILKKLEQGQ